jgi:DNA polymerase-3 subunit gamma/tau
MPASPPASRDIRNDVREGGIAVAPPQPMAPVVPMNRSALPQPKSKKSLLEGLRDKYGDQYQIEEVKEPIPLSMEKLMEIWLAYAAKLSGLQKHSASNTFKICKVEIDSDATFLVKVNALIQQTFIEQERTILLDTIQQAFNNRGISFRVVLEDLSEEEEAPVQVSLNSRQRYEKMVAAYPWVQELRERLKLQLD